MEDLVIQQELIEWAAPVQNAVQVKQILAALTPYAPRSAIRNDPEPGEELRYEQVRDRLIECLAHRLHELFTKTWDQKEALPLLANELPVITGAGARIISLADARSGWPTRRMTSFHENTKACMMLGHVDLELAACWVLRERMGLTGSSDKLALSIDPSSLSSLLEKLITPEHEARNQAFALQGSMSGVENESPATRPRRSL